MTDTTIEARIRAVIIDSLGVDEDKVTPDARIIDDLGADSIDMAQLVIDLEDTFTVEITDDEWTEVKTVADAVKVVSQHMADG